MDRQLREYPIKKAREKLVGKGPRLHKKSARGFC